MRDRGSCISHINHSSKSDSLLFLLLSSLPFSTIFDMIFSAVNICYDPSHHPFAAEGAVKIQNLNSERSAYKIVRAVLRDSDIDPEDAVHYSIHRCYCNFKIKIEDDDEDESFNPESTLDELEIKDADSVFIRKIDVGEAEEEEQGEFTRLRIEEGIRSTSKSE